MTQAIGSTMRAGPALSARADLPRLPGWVVPRRRLADRLDVGASGLVTLVTAPAGWGKTLGVASWAATASLPGGVLWLSAAGAAADPDLFWKLLHTGLAEAGERHLAPVPPVQPQDRHRLQALAQFGIGLRHSGPWLLVLDDFPTGPVGDLGSELEFVMDHAQRGLSLVVLSHGEPAFAVQRHHVAGDLTRITPTDLALDRHEVADVLARHHVDAHELTARTVERHTAGWACGVRLIADALRNATTMEDAVDVADRATIDYLASEVLAKTPARVRELIVRTSMVEKVSPDLARAVLGMQHEVMIAPELASNAFVELDSDGSFRCHRLLRAAASRELDNEPYAVGHEARRRAAQWHIDHDRGDAGLEVLMAAQDWPAVGRALVKTYAVPRILAGSIRGVAESALDVGAVRAAEPLIEAALLLSRDGPDAAAAVLGVIAESATERGETAADELSAIFVRLAVARARGDVDTGLLLATRARELMAHLRIERQRELFAMLEANVGALEMCNGEVGRAEVTLRHGAVGAPGDLATSSAPFDCLGQLALLEAFRGNLRQADRHASAVLKSAGSSPWAGVAHAHLATAWVHLERAEQVPARQHLDRAAGVVGDEAEPWFVTAQLLAEARLRVVTGQPEAAVRLLAPVLQATQHAGQRPSWTRDLLVLAAAEALLATGEPLLALDQLSQATGTSVVETGLLAAKARAAVDDIAGTRAALASVAADLPGATLATQVECWLLEARVAEETERARVLADRALREAAREMMRRPVVPETSWLLPLVDGDPQLRRSHGGFLAGLKSSTHGPSPSASGTFQAASELIETLTGREAEVLGLLAEMCSTEEIARELFLSVNTVKTYVRGILRKLGVNRRVDAVRRGRELGLC